MKKVLSLSLASFLPMLVLAQQINTTYVTGALGAAKSILDSLVVVLMAAGVVWFIWNVIKFTMSDDDEGKGKAKEQMIWGVIAMAVIMSIWGLVGLLQTFFGVGTQGAGDPNVLIPN